MFAILLIENDRLLAAETRSWFQREGYKVDVVDSASEGLKQLQKYDYDVLIMESSLPDMDGVEICSRVSQSNLKLPILMLGSTAGIEDTVKGLDAGAQDFVSKPFQLPELSARVRSLLRRYAKQGIPRAMMPPPVSVPLVP